MIFGGGRDDIWRREEEDRKVGKGDFRVQSQAALESIQISILKLKSKVPFWATTFPAACSRPLPTSLFSCLLYVCTDNPFNFGQPCMVP